MLFRSCDTPSTLDVDWLLCNHKAEITGRLERCLKRPVPVTIFFKVLYRSVVYKGQDNLDFVKDKTTLEPVQLPRTGVTFIGPHATPKNTVCSHPNRGLIL